MTRSEAFIILGISSSSSGNEVKKAYRKLAMKYHPDHNSAANAKQKFIEVHDAYERLTNPEKQKSPHPSSYSQSTGSRRRTTGNTHHFRNQNHNFSNSKYSNKNYQWDDYEERYQRARKAAEEFEEKKSNALYQQFLDDYKNGWKRKWVRFVALIAVVLAFVFTTDQFLPKTLNTAIPSWRFALYTGGDYNIRFDDYSFNIDPATCRDIMDSAVIVQYLTTTIFKDISSALIILPGSPDKTIKINLGLQASTTFPLIPLILLFPMISLFIERPKFNFVFFVIHINIYGIPAMIIFLMVNDGRIIRVLGM